MKKKPARKGIQSIDVGFSILSVLMEVSRPLPLKTISERSGLSPSKVHSYLVSFCALEMVTQHPDTGSYGIGPFALKLGLAFLDQFDLFSAARPEMNRLAEELGATIFLGVWGNRGPTIIYRVDGPRGHAVLDLRIGSVLPVLHSAVGRNLAAHLPESLVTPLITAELAQIRPGLSPRDDIEDPQSIGMVEEMLANIRSNGLSRCRGGLLSDYTAISAPIFDFSGTVRGALTLMERISSFDDSTDGEPSQKLKQACAAISATCGYAPEKTREDTEPAMPTRRSRRGPSV